MKKSIKNGDKIIFYGSIKTVLGTVIDSYKKSVTFISDDDSEIHSVGLNDHRLFIVT